MSLRSKLVCCLALALILGAACKHGAPAKKQAVGQKSEAAPPRAQTHYDIGRDEVQFEIDLLALPSNVYSKFAFGIRKQIESGGLIPRETVDGFMSNTQTKTLMSPRFKVKYGDFGGYMSEVYYPDGVTSGRALPGELELTSVEIDMLPIRQVGSIKLYSVLNLVAKGQLANLHAAGQRVVQPDTGKYVVYKMKSRDGAWDYFMFVKVLTKNE